MQRKYTNHNVRSSWWPNRLDSDFRLVGEGAKENKRTEGSFHDLYSLELEHMEGLVCIP